MRKFGEHDPRDRPVLLILDVEASLGLERFLSLQPPVDCGARRRLRIGQRGLKIGIFARLFATLDGLTVAEAEIIAGHDEIMRKKSAGCGPQTWINTIPGNGHGNEAVGGHHRYVPRGPNV
jgi:hypothetical protein